MQTAMRLLPERTFGLGEGPIWDDPSDPLYWVNIKALAQHWLEQYTAHTYCIWPEIISCFGLAQSGGVIVSGRSGVWTFTFLGGTRTLTHPIPILAQNIRADDGKLGPDGALWILTTPDRSNCSPIIVLVRIASDGDVRILLEGPTTPNSFEWSLDGETFCLIPPPRPVEHLP
jgi:sugar lactone lactonase YvrE